MHRHRDQPCRRPGAVQRRGQRQQLLRAADVIHGPAAPCRPDSPHPHVRGAHRGIDEHDTFRPSDVVGQLGRQLMDRQRPHPGRVPFSDLARHAQPHAVVAP